MVRALLVAVFLVSSMGVTWAQSPKAGVSEAKQLLEIMKMGDIMDSTMEKVLDSQLAASPGLEPFKDDLVVFLKKYASYEALYTDLVDLYAETYTAQEMVELIRFYKSPIGQRTLEVMPDLLSKSQQLGLQRVEDNKAELADMLVNRMALSKP